MHYRLDRLVPEIILLMSGLHIIICNELSPHSSHAREITETSDLVGFEKDHAFIQAVSML